MQIKKHELQRQQMIMAFLGFYKHKCDGIWGPEAIEAKRLWERDSSYIPALPSNGLPFGDRDPLPKNVIYDRVSRLITHVNLTDEQIAEYVAAASVTSNKPSEPKEDAHVEVSLEESTGDYSEAEGAVENSSEQPHKQFQSKKQKHRR